MIGKRATPEQLRALNDAAKGFGFLKEGYAVLLADEELDDLEGDQFCIYRRSADRSCYWTSWAIRSRDGSWAYAHLVVPAAALELLPDCRVGHETAAALEASRAEHGQWLREQDRFIREGRSEIDRLTGDEP